MAQVINGVKVYSPEELGIRPPAGGFQTGGWYQGRQYWNGTLSEPGVIHPLSNQQGAGQAVSKEVVQQTKPENWEYLQRLRQQSNLPPLPQQPKPQQQSRPSFQPQQGTGTNLNIQSMLPQKPKIDLMALYNKYFNTQEIKDLENKIKQREQAYNDAISQINDNPFYSEATRVGRIAKLTDQYQRDVSLLQDNLAKTKADAQVKMNLETKQYDINSQEYKEKINLLNSFLERGAMVNASGQEIADFAVALGVPTSFIQSIIDKQKEEIEYTKKEREAKLKELTKPKLITETDNSGNVWVVAIDEYTGDIIKRTSLGQIGKGKTGSEETGLTPSKLLSIKARAGQILEEVDTNYQTDLRKNKLVENLTGGVGDKRLSALETKLAIERLASETGIDLKTASDIVESRFKELGYSKWKW